MKEGAHLDLRVGTCKPAAHRLWRHAQEWVASGFRSVYFVGRDSLRGRLVATLVGLLLVLLAFEVREYRLRSADRQALVEQTLLLTSRDAAWDGTAHLRELYRSQRHVARMVLSGRVPEEQIQGFLQDVQAADSAIAALEILRPDGQLLHATYGQVYEANRSSDPVVRALSVQRPNVATDLGSNGTDQPSLVRIGSLLTAPDETRLGIVITTYYADALTRSLAPADSGHVEALLDSQGRLIAASSGPLQPQLEEELARAIRRMRPEAIAAVDTRSADGQRLQGYVVPVPETAWKLAYLQPERETGALLAREMRSSLMIMLIVVIILGLAILAVLQVSLRPLVRLSAATRKLGSGDLSLRLPPAEIREFDPLVGAFNRMAERLQGALAELENTNHNLEEQVQDRTRQLEAEHEKLLRAERLSTLGLLSSAIAHDLRNPLNTISLSADWLRLRLREEADERVQARMETIRREVHRSDRIIRTLLAFARTGEPERAPTDLNALVREVVAVAEPGASMTVELDLAPDLPLAPVDRAQLFQVVENLVRNALQAMGEAGSLRLTTQASAEACRVCVADTGPGIPTELLDQVFEPLVSTKSTGTGLGLALCKRIVEAHGGSIQVRSQPGEGTTFIIDLPLVVPEGTVSPEAATVPTRG